jgi:hypothetical protein
MQNKLFNSAEILIISIFLTNDFTAKTALLIAAFAIESSTPREETLLHILPLQAMAA